MSLFTEFRDSVINPSLAYAVGGEDGVDVYDTFMTNNGSEVRTVVIEGKEYKSYVPASPEINKPSQVKPVGFDFNGAIPFMALGFGVLALVIYAGR